MQREFKYKLDFYYQQALIYLVTLIIYAGVKGTFFENNFTLVFSDPILYVIVFFVGIAFIALLLNKIRDRKLVITEKEISFQHRFNKHTISIDDLEWIHIGKERSVQTAGRFQIINFKTKPRRRVFRIRLGRYEREKELLQLIERIAEQVPKRNKRFQFRNNK
jgi:hypothetical protein